MTVQRRDTPLSGLPDSAGDDQTRTQVAALCWRAGAQGVEVVLVTSRDTGRWVLPKGWPVKGRTASEAARREAWEEAGVRGKIGRECLGFYSYQKGMGEAGDLPCVVAVYPMKVKAEARDWPERDERRREWVSPQEAATRVHEPELQRILAAFDPPAKAD